MRLKEQIDPGVDYLAISPDGTRLVGGCVSEGILLWDLRQPSATPVLVDSSKVGDLAFSSDGTRLASSDGETIRIWDLGSRAGDRLCTMVGHNLSVGEWGLYIGTGIPYQRTCPNLPSGAGASEGR